MYKAHGTTLAGIVAEGHPATFDGYGKAIHSRVDYKAHLSRNAPLRDTLFSLPGRCIAFTNGFRAHAQRILEGLGLEDCFERIIALDDMNPGWTGQGPIVCKPQELAFQRALAIIGHVESPHRVALVEDSAKNAKAARSAGMYSVLIGPQATSAAADTANICLDSIMDLRHGAPALWEVSRKRVIIDTDPGVDDMMALLLALSSPELVVEGITVVGGNHHGVCLGACAPVRVLRAICSPHCCSTPIAHFAHALASIRCSARLPSPFPWHRRFPAAKMPGPLVTLCFLRSRRHRGDG